MVLIKEIVFKSVKCTTQIFEYLRFQKSFHVKQFNPKEQIRLKCFSDITHKSKSKIICSNNVLGILCGLEN